MKTRFRRCVPLLGWQLAFVPTFACGYEVETHVQLTEIAFDWSLLGNSVNNPLLELGIADPGAMLPRPSEFGDPTWSSPRAIVADGARLEDLPTAEGRFMRHFFDPQRGGIGLMSATPSPDWVLEDRGEVALQNYSLRDALGYHMQALTNATREERETQLVTLLEILGRSVHHLQDMSQPAHARLDAHAPWEGDIYEKYTKEWFLSNPIPRDAVYGGPVILPGYFNTARAFWANEGAGIAEFTSHNFVSKDTNFRLAGTTFQPDPNHPRPVAVGSSTVTLSDLGLNWALNPSATVEFVHTQVQDQYSGSSFLNDRASTYSIFNADLKPLGGSDRMVLNRFNFAKNYEILLPRAIAYSSGLINYYFRGRLQLENMQGQGAGVALTVKNASEPFYILEGNPAVNAADFRLYYDARDGVRREIELTGGELATALRLDDTVDLSFVEPNDVDRTKEKPYLLVFNGMIGTELGIAALAFGSGNSGFLVTPQYPPADGNVGARLISWNNGGWNPSDGSALQAGSIDWKGHNPVDVLSWGGGGHSRYFPGAGAEIYMNGRVLARAPGWGVLGASIRYVNGVRTLNVAMYSEGRFTIYSRTFADSYANDELWSMENPFGWRLVYSGAHGSPFTGFFFNASGTEGQYITQRIDGGGPHQRVKVTLHGDLGLAETFPAAASVTRVSRHQLTDTSDPKVTAGICTVTPDVPDGALEFEWVDGCLKQAMSGTRSIEHSITETEEYEDRTIFCVDYKGDTEVFCELLPPQPSQVSLSGGRQSIESDYVIFDTFGAACRPWRGNSQGRTEEYSSSNSVRMMRVGGRSIPWIGSEHTETKLDQYSGHFLNSENVSTGHVTETSSGSSRTSKLIYADARYDLVVYETTIHEGSTSASGTYTQDSSEYPWTITEHNVTSVQVILASPDGMVTLYQRDDVQDDERTGTEIAGAQTGFSCAQQPRAWDTSTATSPQRDPEAVQHIYSPMARRGSYVVDGNGRIAASQLVIFEPPHGGPPLEDPIYRHFLSNGNLPGLIPGTPPSEGHGYEIRLIR